MINDSGWSHSHANVITARKKQHFIMHSAFVFWVVLQHYAYTLLWPSFVFVKNLCTIFMWILRQWTCICRPGIWMDIHIYTHKHSYGVHIHTALCSCTSWEIRNLLKAESVPRESNYNERILENLFYYTRYTLTCCRRSTCWALTQHLMYGKCLICQPSWIPFSHQSTDTQLNCTNSSGTTTSSGSYSRKHSHAYRIYEDFAKGFSLHLGTSASRPLTCKYSVVLVFPIFLKQIPFETNSRIFTVSFMNSVFQNLLVKRAQVSHFCLLCRTLGG